MIKKTLILSLAILTLTSCVSMRMYENLQSQYSQSTKECGLAKQEAQELREENAELVRQNQNMTMSLNDISVAQQECEATVRTLNRSYAALQLHYDTTVENYMQQLTSKNRDLTKVNNLLEQRNREIAEKERAFAEKEQLFLERQQELEAHQTLLEQDEEILNQNSQYREQEIEAVGNTLSNTLKGYADKDVNIEASKGKIYITLSDNLMFDEGNWSLKMQGLEVLRKLAKVLESRPDLTIKVVSHTDNTPCPPTAWVKDNWDFSVMHATTIVKMLLREGAKLNAAKIEAVGHGEYTPKTPNTNPTSQALNRRTEIIISLDN